MMYYAEENAITKELEKLNTVKQLTVWSKTYSLQKHPLVVKRLDSMLAVKVNRFESVDELTNWAEENHVESHSLVKTRLEELHEMDVDSNLEELNSIESDVIHEEIDQLPNTQAVREWSHDMNVEEHPVVKRKIQCLREEREMETDNDIFMNVNLTFQKCKTCFKTFSDKESLQLHIRQIHRQQRHCCKTCAKSFSSVSNRNRHEKRCTGPTLMLRQHQCDICAARFATLQELRTHHHLHQTNQIGEGERNRPSCSKESTCTQSSSSINPTDITQSESRQELLPSSSQGVAARGMNVRCRKCKEIFTSRRALYLHNMMRHHHGNGEGASELQRVPWDNEPWKDNEGNVNEDFEEVYRANSPFILAANVPGGVRETYNMPLNNDINTDMILDTVRAIYESQRYAFRINFMLGMILRNVETGELRYFIPDQNETLLDQPMRVNRIQDINGKLRGRLDRIDVMEYLLRQRSESKWRPFFITNLKVIVFKSNFLLGSGVVDVPDYIVSNNSICALNKRRKGVPYRDNLCAFRCLAKARGQTSLETATGLFYQEWVAYLMAHNLCDLTTVAAENFSGVNWRELNLFESCFGINVNIYFLEEDGTAQIRYRSMGRYKDTMYLNVFENHLSLITNIKAYAKKYLCSICNKPFKTSFLCSRHERTCGQKTKFSYPGGHHQMNRTIFDQLEEYDIVVDEEERFFPWFIVFDFEALLKPVQEKNDGKLRWSAEHVPISVSLCSNVDAYRKPQCIVNANVDELVADMIAKMEEIAAAVSEIAQEKWRSVFEQLTGQINSWSSDESNSGKIMHNALKILRSTMLNYCNQVPVLGFNSARYDLNLIKKYVAKHLRMHDTDTSGITVKRNNTYTCISNSNLKFLDLCQYLAPGTSYVKFLKAYGVKESKGFFPYEYLTDHSKLEETSLPQHQAFYSTLKGTNITQEEYAFCKRIWEENNMGCMKDFLIWYNNLDVGPMVTAVERLQEFYFSRQVDVFKVAMSVPGVARQMLFRSGKEAGATFALIGEGDKDLFHTIKNNIVGGPSIIFNRHAKASETFIRNNAQKPCKRVVGFDANALYLWALNQTLPTGAYIRRREENGFKPEVRDKYMTAYHWMDWLAMTSRKSILHKLNNGKEKRVGPYPVDGYCAQSNTIYQFHGCYFHGHNCSLTKNVKNKEEQKERLKRTNETSAFLKSRGYNLVEMWECQFNNIKRSNVSLQNFITERTPSFHKRHRGGVSEKEILNAVRDDVLFGMVEVDIAVPETWSSEFRKDITPYEYFEEMAPLFCTTDIPFTAIGEHMRKYVEDNNLSKNPRRLLVGGMKGRKMLIATPLLKWYLKHGMVVTKVYQVVEYTPMRCFRKFVSQVSEARRLGDSNADMSVIADTMKLIGNSGYGGLIMDKSKHRAITYVSGETKACHAINQKNFRNITALGDEYFEVEMAKQSITFNLPIQLGYFILQYAKLRMLEFYYDFMDVYVDRADFEYCEMDTDSAYMAISGESLVDVIKPDMKAGYLQGVMGFCEESDIEADAWFHWFPRMCCDNTQK